MTDPLSIQLTAEQVQAVLNCVGPAVSRLELTGVPREKVEASPIWQAERILDSTLLEWENAQTPAELSESLRFVACPGCHKIDETEIATDGSVCCPHCGLRYNPTHPSSQPQPTSFGFGGHASKENKS